MVAWRGVVAERVLPALAGVIVLAAAWEAIVRLMDIQPYVLPAPSTILAATWSNLPTLMQALAATMKEALSGFALGIAIGIVLAMFLVFVPPLEGALMPVLVAVNSVPVVAYTPLALIWLGIGPNSKIAMVTLAVSFVILINVLHGLKRPDQAQIDMMRSFGANALTTMTKLRLPAAMPSLVNGLRVGIVRSIIIAIVTEMLGAYQGIGWVIFQATQQVNFLEVWAAVLTSSIASMILYIALVWADQKLVWWK